MFFRGMTSKNNGGFYCLNCFTSFRTTNAIKKHGNFCRDHDYGYVEIPNKECNILKYNLEEKSMEISFVIYADFESILKEISTCSNDPKKSSTTKTSKHIPSDLSLFTYCVFDETKNQLNYHRGKDCTKAFCKILKNYVERIMYMKKKK